MTQQFTFRYEPKSNEKMRPQENLYTDVYSSIMHKAKNVETRMLIHVLLDNEIIIYTHNEIVCSLKKEKYIDIHYNLNEDQKKKSEKWSQMVWFL